MADADLSCAAELLSLALQRIPNLTANGVGIFDEWNVRRREGREAVERRTPEEQAELKASLDEIDLCSDWIRAFMVPIKTINVRHSSYGYEHHVENWCAQRRANGEDIPGHISNGAFIAAAVGIGCRFKVDEPNAYFNLSEKPITELIPLAQRTADLRHAPLDPRP